MPILTPMVAVWLFNIKGSCKTLIILSETLAAISILLISVYNKANSSPLNRDKDQPRLFL
jgi:hypothetical protein